MLGTIEKSWNPLSHGQYWTDNEVVAHLAAALKQLSCPCRTTGTGLINPFANLKVIMGQDLAKIERLYDSVAEEYAAAFADELDRKPKDREMLLRFSRLLGAGRPVWDFGCGPGQAAQYLNDLGIQTSGLDLSEKLLRQARTIHPGIDFRKGNILALEFADNSIAGSVAFYVIVHFSQEQVRLAFREVFRVLQPGGVFLMSFHIGGETMHLDEFLNRKIDIEFMFFTTAFISGCLQECGFGRIEIIERDPYPGVEYQSRRAYVFSRKPGVLGTPCRT